MKKTVLLIILIFLFSFSFIFADTLENDDANVINDDYYLSMGYIPSNAIGQERRESEGGYYLDKKDNTSFLIKDGMVIKTFKTEKEGKYTVRTETDAGGNTIVYKYDDQGSLVSFIDENGFEETLIYDNSLHLISSNIKKDGFVISEKVYYRSPKTGMLIGIKENDNFSFFLGGRDNSLFVVGNEYDYETYETFFGSVTYRLGKDENNNTYTTSEDEKGNLTITYDGGKTTYSKEGRIIEDNGVKYFYYDSGILNYTEVVNNDITTKDYYKDAAIVVKEEFNKDEDLLKRYTYSSDEIKLELYEKNKPYAVITYAGDGVKVLDVRYL